MTTLVALRLHKLYLVGRPATPAPALSVFDSHMCFPTSIYSHSLLSLS